MKRSLTLTATSALLAATAVTGCSASATASAPAGPVLKVTGAYVPQPPLADMAAGYFTITNTGRAPDKLTSVTSDFASDIELNTTTAAGQMQAVTSLSIPAGGSLVLHTGGNHLMLMGLTRKPVVGDSVAFELHFATSAPITVKAPVEPMTYQPAP